MMLQCVIQDAAAPADLYKIWLNIESPFSMLKEKSLKSDFHQKKIGQRSSS